MHVQISKYFGAVVGLVALTASPCLAGAKASKAAIEELLNQSLDEAVAESDSTVPGSPTEEAVQSLKQLQKQLKKEGAADPEAATSALCIPTVASLCLYGRFVVAGVWENPYSAPGVLNLMYAVQLTPYAGYMWFFSPANMEVPIKMVNFCPLGRFGVFAAGLSDFGVSLGVRDMITGIQVNYINDPKTVFNTIIDQQTPWPCL